MAMVFDESKIQRTSIMLTPVKKKNQIIDSSQLLKIQHQSSETDLQNSKVLNLTTSNTGDSVYDSPGRKVRTDENKKSSFTQLKESVGTPVVKSEFTKNSPKQTGSILKNARASTSTSILATKTKPRIDNMGNPITKGGKKHHIQFNEKIAKMHAVDNWKNYNSSDYQPTSCNCSLM